MSTMVHGPVHFHSGFRERGGFYGGAHMNVKPYPISHS